MKKKIGGEKKDQRSLTIKDKIVNDKIPKTISRKLYSIRLNSHQRIILIQGRLSSVFNMNNLFNIFVF